MHIQKSCRNAWRPDGAASFTLDAIAVILVGSDRFLRAAALNLGENNFWEGMQWLEIAVFTGRTLDVSGIGEKTELIGVAFIALVYYWSSKRRFCLFVHGNTKNAFEIGLAVGLMLEGGLSLR